ncbi:CvpA family protein [Neoehrlichia mikurensis]|uniref:CvpA family protein n=1 Tax=Neoehrlichia mikurensis TaxID=89586 RepID=A0A9Q9BTP8_9RICK|nr:CvpA family protein [Neoehrlichia mikurensis]QXK91717.1 CvpA family protein [Neoehrlichia mikurensis]QXK92929.1 CvpA family protein [Neoehrlichia mikurensis]QXK93407.1 CvpA family protein [Neoehrlichia mikurensis]UTO55642.1 CvpA family protein [Neoehrlichia mikurensis]UTO56562.1 CvpA family protein [Neoehrlichia mikurensis]
MLDIAVIIILLLCMFVGFFRGFIKEVFGICGIVASILLTANYHDYFFDIYSKRINSEIIVNALSTVTVFISITVCVIILNSFLMYLLLPIRYNVLDRVAGLLVGIIKGMVFSCCLYFIIETCCYTFLYSSDEDNEEIVLPAWFSESYYYNIFYVINDYVSEVVPEFTYDKIKVITHEILSKRYSKNDKKNSVINK